MQLQPTNLESKPLKLQFGTEDRTLSAVHPGKKNCLPADYGTAWTLESQPMAALSAV